MFPNLFLITLGAAVNGGRPWCSCIEGRAPTEALFLSQKYPAIQFILGKWGDNNKTDRIMLLPPAKLMQPASHLSQKSKVTIFEAGNKCLFIRIMRKPPYFYKSISREITHSQKLGNMLSFFNVQNFAPCSFPCLLVFSFWSIGRTFIKTFPNDFDFIGCRMQMPPTSRNVGWPTSSEWSKTHR